jgi:hypothetical protein
MVPLHWNQLEKRAGGKSGGAAGERVVALEVWRAAGAAPDYGPQ